MRIGSAAAVIMMTAVTAVYAGVAKAACAPPSAEALTNQRVMGFKRTFTTPLRSSGERLRWFSVSGTSMMQGQVFVVDCRGAKRADIGLGAVEVQKPGPMVAGRPSLIVVYHTDSGSDVVNDQDVALLQYRRGAITKLWDHTSLEAAYPPKSLGHREETIYRWRFTPDARRIEVTGRHLIYHDQETNGPLRKGDIWHVRRLRREQFCLNIGGSQYRPCH